MPTLGLESEVVDRQVLKRSIARCRERGVVLPTFAELANPSLIPNRIQQELASIGPDEAHPLNLFRVHWYNDSDRQHFAQTPCHIVLPPALTGVRAPIVVALGALFPMITAHKVLAAYGCLAPRLITGQYDPTRHKAVWPSTGNYCRGGVAVSRIMGCRGVAILPEQMSQERFDWLDQWVLDPSDVVRTPGSESNVKEIYDKCAELQADPQNVIFNQFCEFGNALVHYNSTGRALEHIFEGLHATNTELELFAYVSATGSAGTIAAGDRLKDSFGTRIVAVESVECPTLLRNGFGEHNIQGIGDKHIPYIHNAYNTDLLVGISDAATDSLSYVFNDPIGREYLRNRRGVPAETTEALQFFGYSSIANILAAIKVAKYYDLGPHQAIFTVATDGAALYQTERSELLQRRFSGRFDEVSAGEAVGQYLMGAATDELQELSLQDQHRIFNLGYFTWVEQQGVSVEEFRKRKDQRFWRELRALIPAWDALIQSFNEEVARG
jgi:cysteine synthase